MPCDDSSVQQKTPLLSWQGCIQWKVMDSVWLIMIYVFTVQNLKIKVKIEKKKKNTIWLSELIYRILTEHDVCFNFFLIYENGIYNLLKNSFNLYHWMRKLMSLIIHKSLTTGGHSTTHIMDITVIFESSSKFSHTKCLPSATWFY